MTEKYFFAAQSYMGLEYTLVYAFGTKQERDSWVKSHEYNENGNRVAQVVTKREAIKIAPELSQFFCDNRNIENCIHVVVPPPNPSPAAVLGRLGGLKTSPVKAQKSRENGRKGGAPIKNRSCDKKTNQI
jgi:hypothetical protein